MELKKAPVNYYLPTIPHSWFGLEARYLLTSPEITYLEDESTLRLLNCAKH